MTIVWITYWAYDNGFDTQFAPLKIFLSDSVNSSCVHVNCLNEFRNFDYIIKSVIYLPLKSVNELAFIFIPAAENKQQHTDTH